MTNEIENILEALNKSKLEDIRVYDLNSTNPFFNFIICSTATNKRQLQSAIKYIDELNIKYNHIEGLESTEWVLIDAGEILINIFTSEARDEYSLDSIYSEYLIK